MDAKSLAFRRGSEVGPDHLVSFEADSIHTAPHKAPTLQAPQNLVGVVTETYGRPTTSANYQFLGSAPGLGPCIGRPVGAPQ